MISIEEARKILGKNTNDMSDEEIQELLNNLQYLARRVLDNKI